jgi:hypothetical protein
LLCPPGRRSHLVSGSVRRAGQRDSNTFRLRQSPEEAMHCCNAVRSIATSFCRRARRSWSRLWLTATLSSTSVTEPHGGACRCLTMFMPQREKPTCRFRFVVTRPRFSRAAGNS